LYVPNDYAAVLPRPLTTERVVGFTAENAKEMGQRGVEARRQKAEQRASMTADARAREVLASNAEALARELLNAALGRGDYAGELKGRDRMHAVIKALEWGIGRPVPASPPEEPRIPDEDVGLIIE
jgi:hypothetical protein